MHMRPSDEAEAEAERPPGDAHHRHDLDRLVRVEAEASRLANWGYAGRMASGCRCGTATCDLAPARGANLGKPTGSAEAGFEGLRSTERPRRRRPGESGLVVGAGGEA